MDILFVRLSSCSLCPLTMSAWMSVCPAFAVFLRQSAERMNPCVPRLLLLTANSASQHLVATTAAPPRVVKEYYGTLGFVPIESCESIPNLIYRAGDRDRTLLIPANMVNINSQPLWIIFICRSTAGAWAVGSSVTGDGWRWGGCFRP